MVPGIRKLILEVSLISVPAALIAAALVTHGIELVETRRSKAAAAIIRRVVEQLPGNRLVSIRWIRRRSACGRMSRRVFERGLQMLSEDGVLQVIGSSGAKGPRDYSLIRRL